MLTQQDSYDLARRARYGGPRNSGIRPMDLPTLTVPAESLAWGWLPLGGPAWLPAGLGVVLAWPQAEIVGVRQWGEAAPLAWPGWGWV